MKPVLARWQWPCAVGLIATLVGGSRILLQRGPGVDGPASELAPVLVPAAGVGAAAVQGVAKPPLAAAVHGEGLVLPAPAPATAGRWPSRPEPPAQQDGRKLGYEMPFAEAGGAPEGPASSASVATAQRRAALEAALASGRSTEVFALVNTGEVSTEIEAMRWLLEIGSAEAMANVLGRMLTLAPDNPDYDRYLEAFGNGRSPAIANWLAEFLGQTPVEESRQRALVLLSALRGRELVDSLVASLAHSSDRQHAEDSAGLLIAAVDPAQGAALVDLLVSETSPDMRVLAAYGLASVGDADACDVLAEVGASADAIAPGCREALATVASAYGQESLIFTAGSSGYPSVVRVAAVRALSRQPGERVNTVLANLMQATADRDLQAAIHSALAFAGTGRPVPSGGTAGDVEKNGEVGF